jgi:polysaccharide pyruvyl transferase WcaK-like protein
MDRRHQVIHFDILHGKWENKDLSFPNKETHVPLTTDDNENDSAETLKLNSYGLSKKITPNALRRIKSYWLHMRKNISITPQLRKAIVEADTVFIGGGHLLIDTYWTFPLSVRRIAVEAMRLNKPFHLVFVGARGPWSLLGKRWMLEVCRNAETIAVRDEDSRRFLVGMDRMLEQKTVALSDPALFTMETFDFRLRERSKRRIIGLGVMDPYEMNRHCNLRWERNECALWWRELAFGLTESGCDVRIFTNGANTDNAFVEKCLKPQIGNHSNIIFVSYPKTVKQLVGSIVDCDVVIAQRLHACIPAISMGKPTFGLIWDRKLENIFKDLYLESFLIDFRQSVDKVIAKILRCSALPEESLFVIDQKKKKIIEYLKGILP